MLSEWFCETLEGKTMTLETTRLLLRPWKQSDAESLYEYAKDPRVGPIAGWPVHTSVENSRDIILEVLSAAETYAVTVKGDDTAIGSIGLMVGGNSNLGISENEGGDRLLDCRAILGAGIYPGGYGGADAPRF